ncbi:MAG: hypothetical protein DRP42_04540 [Tenericutes bacterium]|nr:MAG: hypothetical protein DRP42_04540 [Mycoplasmatota bacterium]
MPNSSLSQPFSLLCEGAGGAYEPDSVYVVQGDKAYVFYGEPQALSESVGDSYVLVESYDDLELVEGLSPLNEKILTPKDGKWIVEGVFQRSDTKNANGRTYARKIWERIIKDLNSSVQQIIKAGGMIGHLEHPKDGRTDGKEGALVVRKLELKEDGTVWGRAELLDTPNGLILQEYTKKNVRWGVSSRGNGSVGEDGDVNEADYKLETFDGVMRPSTPGAYPRLNNSKGDKLSGKGKTIKESVEVTALLDTVNALVEVDSSEFDNKRRASLIKDMATTLATGATLGTAEEVSNGNLTTVMKLLGKKIMEVTSLTMTDALVEDTIDDSEDSTNDDDYFALAEAVDAERQQWESITAQLKGENAELRAQLATALDHEDDDDEIDGGVDYKTQAEYATSQVESLKRTLETARGTIAELTEEDTTDTVQETVDAAIKKCEDLAEFRSILERAKTPGQVTSLANKLAISANGTRKRAANPGIRPTLPTDMHVISESDASKKYRSDKPPASQGATLAAGAVSRMK